MKKKLNNIELFAGAGGLLDGFEQTGVQADYLMGLNKLVIIIY